MQYTSQRLNPLPRKYIPADFDVTDWNVVKAELEKLISRQPDSAEALLQLIFHASELSSALGDELSWRYIRMTSHADKPEYSDEFNDYNANVFSPCEPYRFRMQQIFYSSPYRKDLPAETYAHLEQIIANEIELFREENIPLKVQEQELATNYGSIISQLSAPFEGEDRTPAQLGVFLKDPDRNKREQAWRLIAGLYHSQVNELDSLYDNLRQLRTTIASNTGFDNYRDYMHRAMGRFSYTPEDLYKFHDAVEQVIVPFDMEMDEHRRKTLGVDTLRPWDLAVDLDGKKLVPFETTDEFISKAVEILHRVNPEYGIQLEMMRNTDLLDLENRKGKAPGGYNTSIHNLGSSFIFMNAVKLHGDVTTLLHESGHAMHSAAMKHIPIDYYTGTPSEVAELASMSMELITMDYWDIYYPNPEDYNKARRDQLEGTLSFLPWCMIVDAFQHWVYLHPHHTPQERRAAFVDLHKRFAPSVDWTGLEYLRDSWWMKQLHIFEVPFYYIEYGMAQLGALAIYKNYRENKQKALRQYQDFLNLGYSKPVREIYRTAGINFDFSASYLKELVDFVRQELAAIK